MRKEERQHSEINVTPADVLQKKKTEKSYIDKILQRKIEYKH